MTHAVPTLILMRHAAAAPAEIDGADFDRPLTAAGRSAAAHAAHQLAADGVRIGHVLYSPARRTRDTATIVAGELQLAGSALQEVAALYLAGPEAIRAAIAAHGGSAVPLLIIGHNPGLSEFGGELAERYAARHLATAGIWRIALEPQAWRALRA